MRIAVIGTSGQLGHDLQRVLATHEHEVVAIAGRAELDITHGAKFVEMLEREAPAAVINTAAFHNVDLCEKEAEAAYRTNVLAVREMARACEARGVLLVQIGTDYVFGGSGENGPYAEPIPESAPATPNSIYSLTRFGGDCMTLAHAPTEGYVVRTCGLFGVAGCKLKGGKNFVDSMIEAARAGKPLRVVNDQIVAPTPTDDLARQLMLMLEHRTPAGLYHAVSHGECSWHDFAVTALALAGMGQTVEAVSSAAFAAAAKRPAYSVLDNAKLRKHKIDIMRPWRESLERYVREKYRG